MAHMTAIHYKNNKIIEQKTNVQLLDFDPRRARLELGGLRVIGLEEWNQLAFFEWLALLMAC